MADPSSSANVIQPPAPDADAVIDVDTGDSTYGSDTSSVAGSASLASTIYNYKYENGRRYHAFRDGTYLLPNDEAEQDRLDLHHHIFGLILEGRLFRAPIATSAQRILDIGTGTGIWAVDMADEFPEAMVIGTDLSPIQPDLVAPNLHFYVDDFESEWTYSESERFDFIHGRGLGGSVADFSLLYGRVFEHLKPGGWVEDQEYEGWIYSDDDPELDKAPNVRQWQNLMDEASRKFGKRLNIAKDQKQHMIDAGFINVCDDVYKVPIGTWAKDPKLKVLGAYQLENMCLCLEAFTLAPLTRILGWSVEETFVLIAKIKNEFRNRSNHLITVFHFTYGQKPADGA